MNQNQFTVEELCANESFQTYCLGTDKAAIEQWTKWIAAHPEQSDTINAAERMVLQLSAPIPKEELQIAFQDLSQQITPPSKQPKRIFRRQWLAIAATLTLLLAAIAWWMMPQDIPLQVYTTDFGKTQSIELTDGTSVKLNANSSLKTAESWKKTQDREVWLTGEAFFDVPQNGQKFIVHTSKGDIQVLGTSFNVQDRSEQLKVALIEGKVAVDVLNEKRIELAPGEVLSLENGSIQKENADVELLAPWRTGKLVFKNTKVAQVIDRLEELYNWQIKVENQSILDRKIKATVPQEKPELLLEALREIYEINIVKTGELTFEIR